MINFAETKVPINFSLLALLAFNWTILSNTSWAFNTDSKNYQLSGFATLAYTHSGSDSLGFRREIDRKGLFDNHWSFSPDSIIGLQLDFSATKNITGAIQLVGKDRVENKIENSIEWAFLGYQWDDRWKLRIGRVGYDTFLSSEYRNIGFAYLWVRPPPEYYSLVTFFSLDGIDFAWSQTMGGGILRLKALAGQTKNSTLFFGQIRELELENIVGLNIGWESDKWRLRFSAVRHNYFIPGNVSLGYDQLVGSLDQIAGLWPEAANYADQLVVKSNDLHYFAIGSTFSSAPWQVQNEFSYTASDEDSYPSQVSGFVSIGLQLNEYTPYVIVAAAKSEGDPDIIPAPPVIPGDPQASSNLRQLHSSVQIASDTRNTNQTSIALGLRWDVHHNVAIKTQLDHSKVDQRGYNIWDIRTPPEKDQSINTFTLSLDWLF